MVSKPTVLVVGAGGSMPYGYPSGRQLVAGILKNLRDIQRKRRDDTMADYYGYPLPLLEKFRLGLENSHLYSIDAFLGKPNHQEIVGLGKILIAVELLKYEKFNVTAVSPSGDADDWYAYLVNRLSDNISFGKGEPLTILTYNYDRSLDFYLTTSLQAAFSFEEDELPDRLQGLKIIHLHGQLSKLPVPLKSGATFTPETLLEYRHYGHVDLNGLVETAAAGIKIIHENHPSQGIDREAQKALAQAERVCFLGFSYNELNMRLLTSSGWARRVTDLEVFGSRYQMTDSEIVSARKFLSNRFGFAPAANERCEQTLRRYSEILS